MSFYLTFHEVVLHRAEQVLSQAINFDLAPQQLLWVQGENGIGKTTLLRMAAGLIKTRQGEIIWQKNATDCTASQLVSLQSYEQGFHPLLSAQDNLHCWTQFYGFKEGLSNIYTQVGFTQNPNLSFHVLSSGQQRRLSLARLLISRRPIWLMDEPMASLDKQGCELTMHIITTHIKQGGSALIASHIAPKKLAPHTRRLTLTSA